MRSIVGLTWARACPWPSCIPHKSRLRGARAAGIRYEKAVAKAIPNAQRGQWFEYSDANGHGYCQPDILVVGRSTVLVIECKLTDTELARQQLDYLYLPIVEHVYRRPAIGIVVVRHLTRATPRAAICTTLSEALRNRGELVHWLGHTALA